MSNFILSIKEILEEQNKSIGYLFDAKVISKNTFYKYSQRLPSLKSLLKISNYLKVNIDYLFELSNENNYKEYDLVQDTFYGNLNSLISSNGISQRQFCKDLNYARANLTRWKNGINPSVQTILEIARYFNCSTDELLKRK